MLYTVFIAICLHGTPVKDCNQLTAQDWIVAPEPQFLSMCAVHAQQYAAQSHLVRAGEFIKVFCKPVVRSGNMG